MTETLETCRLYLVVEPGPGAREVLAAALAAGPVASLLIRPATGEKLGAGEVKPLVDLAQRQGVAALLADDAAMARTLHADGVHLGPGDDVADRYEAAREIVGRGAIVGVDAGISRDDAMALAEAGADYVAFGVPRQAADRDSGQRERDDLAEWWAEIVVMPCVVFDVESPEEAGAVASLGVDFVAVPLPRSMPPATAGRFVADLLAAIGDAGSEIDHV